MEARVKNRGRRQIVKSVMSLQPVSLQPSGSAFEQAFQVMVVILVQATDGRLFFVPPHLPSDIVIFPAIAGF